jgi:hypothetical protein
MPSRSATLLHLPALSFFVGLAALWSFPLVVHLASCIPGATSGDGPTFVWNNWWMRLALDSPDQQFFWTPLQFAPLGTSLVLHTHTALPSFVSATLFRSLPVLTATNVTILSALVLNGFTAYLFAHAIAKSRAAALVAGVIFGASPYVSRHLLGHFNLIHVWVLPLCLWCAYKAESSRKFGWAAASGLVFVGAIYTDYYLAIYTGGTLVLLAACRLFSVAWLGQARSSPQWLTRPLLILAVLCGAAALLIQASGGGVFLVGPWRISARRPGNLVTVGWLGLVTYAVLRWGPCLRASRSGHQIRPLLVLSFVAPLVLLLPLIVGALDMWRAGDYASQPYSWRSSPRGVDLASLILGNPSHPLTGQMTRTYYGRQGIDSIEGVGWLGTPLLIALWLLPGWRRRSDGRSLACCGVAFLLWAFGPWLTVAGHQTGVLLPALALRWVPLLSNARMPGRAMVVVYLMVGTLVALGLARRSSRPRFVLIATLIGLVTADYAAMPFPIGCPRTSDIYAQLAGTAGNVLELPLGIRDGFGEAGVMDSQVLLNQFRHKRPILGGFVARLSPRVRDAYNAEPLTRALLAASSGVPVIPAGLDSTRLEAERRVARDGLAAFRVTTVVVNRSTATSELLRYVELALPVARVSGDKQHDVYSVQLQQRSD